MRRASKRRPINGWSSCYDDRGANPDETAGGRPRVGLLEHPAMVIGAETPMRHRPDALPGRREAACYGDRGVDPDEISHFRSFMKPDSSCYRDRGVNPDETDNFE